MMTELRESVISWLTTCPVNDSNHTGALKRATEDELNEAISRISGKDGHKSRVTACERELRKRRKLSAQAANS